MGAGIGAARIMSMSLAAHDAIRDTIFEAVALRHREASDGISKSAIAEFSLRNGLDLADIMTVCRELVTAGLLREDGGIFLLTDNAARGVG
jgi:hypothetical protein